MIGLTSPGRVGGDVCHLNLHKTFGMYVEDLPLVRNGVC